MESESSVKKCKILVTLLLKMLFFLQIELRMNRPLVKVGNNLCFESKESDRIRFIPYTHFCAFYLDYCDVIGPIMGIDTKSYSNKPYWYIYGFVAYKPDDCKSVDKIPHVGTKIVPYMDWIFSVLNIRKN